VMPRTSRAIAAGHCYHVINRGNNQLQRFHDRADYIAFIWLIAEANDHVPLPIIAACLMPNHVHLVVRTAHDGDLARWAHWLFTTHARRYHKKYKSSGRVWQGRYKAFVIQQDAHLLTVLRYVERNALSANLTPRAEKWEWGSLHWRVTANAPLKLEPSPVPLPQNWIEFVNTPQTPEEVEAIRNCVSRQSPFGSPTWSREKATEFGLEQSLAPLGRPRKQM
jgi:putative transposase